MRKKNTIIETLKMCFALLTHSSGELLKSRKCSYTKLTEWDVLRLTGIAPDANVCLLFFSQCKSPGLNQHKKCSPSFCRIFAFQVDVTACHSTVGAREKPLMVSFHQCYLLKISWLAHVDHFLPPCASQTPLLWLDPETLRYCITTPHYSVCQNGPGLWSPR